MQIPLQISFHGLDSSPAVEARVREKAATLERFSKRITSGRVVIDSVDRRHSKGNLYKVRIMLAVPGGEIVVDRGPGDRGAHEDVYVAIRDAFNAAVRQLEDHVRIGRGRVKAHETPRHGRITELYPDAGNGFIETSDGLEVYFHENSVIGGFAQLEIGTEVRFAIHEGEGEKGPQASTVTPIGKHHIVD